MKKLALIIPFLLNCGPYNQTTVDLTGCYKAKLLLSDSKSPNDYYEQDNHTFCASKFAWDSYKGKPNSTELTIDETRIVQFDNGTTTTQEYYGWARADWADIYDHVTISRANGDNDSFTLLFQYENVVKVGSN